MKTLLLAGIANLAIAALTSCAPTAQEAPKLTQDTVAAIAQTEPTTSGDTASAVIVPSDDAVHSRILAAAGLGGIEIYDLHGKRLQSIPGGDITGVDVGYRFPIGDHHVTVLAAANAADNTLWLFTLQGTKAARAGVDEKPFGFGVEGVCLAHNPVDGALYAFVLGEDGSIAQQVIYAGKDGKLRARDVRTIHLPSELKGCAASRDGHLYVAEESVGIWRLQIDPEADLSATLIDTRGHGHLGKKTKGLALYDGGKGHQWLLASDSSGGHVNVYDLSRDATYVGSVILSAPGKSTPIKEPGALFATSMELGKSFPHGALVVDDEDGGSNQKVVSMAAIAQALKLDPGNAQDPRKTTTPTVPTVTALAETKPVASPGDAADDPAIWANPKDPSASLAIGTDKKAGMYVYDMQGHVTDFRPDGNMNNTDLRAGFDLGGKDSVLVTASNRSDDSVAIYRLDTAARKLVDVAAGTQDLGLGDPYGLCMYRNPDTGKTYVFVNNKDGLMRQWQLVDDGGRVHVEKVRQFHFDSQVEGCAADDHNGSLFVDEEDVALWAMSAHPDGGDKMTAVDRVKGNPALKSDLEGLGVYDLGHGKGYIVISVQGNDTYAVYRLGGDHAYLGSFAVVADPARGIDGISQTDGLEVTNRNLGPGFEHGAMIAQDGRNVMPQENQNFKYVSWDTIAQALHLEVRSTP